MDLTLLSLSIKVFEFSLCQSLYVCLSVCLSVSARSVSVSVSLSVSLSLSLSPPPPSLSLFLSRALARSSSQNPALRPPTFKRRAQKQSQSRAVIELPCSPNKFQTGKTSLCSSGRPLFERKPVVVAAAAAAASPRKLRSRLSEGCSDFAITAANKLFRHTLPRRVLV